MTFCSLAAQHRSGERYDCSIPHVQQLVQAVAKVAATGMLQDHDPCTDAVECYQVAARSGVFMGAALHGCPQAPRVWLCHTQPGAAGSREQTPLPASYRP